MDMSPLALLLTVCSVWVAAEIFIIVVKRSQPGQARREDKKSGLVLTFCLALSPLLGGVLSSFEPTKMPTWIQWYAFYGGIALIVIGFAIRLAAIFTLRRYFTVDVAIANDHKVIDSGLYGIVRHPSYAGSLISFFGLGLAFVNWLSLAILIIGPAVGLAYRIRVEEQALIGALGDDYRAYASRTKRLIPGVF
jgi:protein-S-isoprenylcysteine O-methyltransferase Ste14